MRTYLRLFFSLYGRINRRVFRFGWVILTFVNLAVLGAMNSVLGPDFVPAGLVLTLYPTICVYTHRLHDLGRSGWWQIFPRVATGLVLVFVFSPWLQHRLFLAAVHDSEQPNFIAASGTLVLMLITLVGLLADIGLFAWLALKRGESRPADLFE